MKHFLLLFFLFAAAAGRGHAQNPVADTHPDATISIIDSQSGQLTPVSSDAAILFKDAFVDLVINTNAGHLQKLPGRRSFAITQVDPTTYGNVYKLTIQRTYFGQVIPIASFQYNVDKNLLFFYVSFKQTWVPELILPGNATNLANCQTYGTFNEPAAPAPSPAPDSGQPATGPDNSSAAVDTSATATVAPPELKEEVQPECPVEGDLWQPGIWAYNATGYYWVPGLWAAPPDLNLLWTPAYWGFADGLYAFHAGYWGGAIGFYGGINYGYGFNGHGFVGGRWEGGHFRYNTAILRVNARFRNTYVDRTAVFHGLRNRGAFNGRGGVIDRPRPEEIRAKEQAYHSPDHGGRVVTPGRRDNFHPTTDGRQTTPGRTTGNSHSIADGKQVTQGKATGTSRPITNGKQVTPGKTNTQPPKKGGSLLKAVKGGKPKKT